MFFVGLILFGLFVALPQQRTVMFRQRLFALREELFDYAREGNISFSHPAYQLQRNFLNGFIRYAHRLTLLQVCITFHRWQTLGDEHALSWHKKWETALEPLPQPAEVQMRAFHYRAVAEIVLHLIMGSPILWVVAARGVIIAFTQAAGSSVGLAWKQFMDKVVKDHADNLGDLAIRS